MIRLVLLVFLYLPLTIPCRGTEIGDVATILDWNVTGLQTGSFEFEATQFRPRENITAVSNVLVEGVKSRFRPHSTFFSNSRDVILPMKGSGAWSGEKYVFWTEMYDIDDRNAKTVVISQGVSWDGKTYICYYGRGQALTDAKEVVPADFRVDQSTVSKMGWIGGENLGAMHRFDPIVWIMSNMLADNPTNLLKLPDSQVEVLDDGRVRVRNGQVDWYLGKSVNFMPVLFESASDLGPLINTSEVSYSGFDDAGRVFPIRLVKQQTDHGILTYRTVYDVTALSSDLPEAQEGLFSFNLPSGTQVKNRRDGTEYVQE